MEKYDRAGQPTDDSMAHAHFVLAKATNPHSEYVIIIPFPMQQWLREPDSLLRYTYAAYLVSLLTVL